MTARDAALFETIWSALDGGLSAPSLELSGTPGLPSVYDVGSFATATIAAATAAVASVESARSGEPARSVHVDRSHASLAFRCGCAQARAAVMTASRSIGEAVAGRLAVAMRATRAP